MPRTDKETEMIDLKKLRSQAEECMKDGCYPRISAYTMIVLLDALQAAQKDAERYRWLCDGNGYFLEEEMLCGYENEKQEADDAIDAAMTNT